MSYNLYSRSRFIKELSETIITHGYWSKEVRELNSLCQETVPYLIWKRWHDEAKIKVEQENKQLK